MSMLCGCACCSFYTFQSAKIATKMIKRLFKDTRINNQIPMMLFFDKSYGTTISLVRSKLYGLYALSLAHTGHNFSLRAHTPYAAAGYGHSWQKPGFKIISVSLCLLSHSLARCLGRSGLLLLKDQTHLFTPQAGGRAVYNCCYLIGLLVLIKSSDWCVFVFECRSTCVCAQSEQLELECCWIILCAFLDPTTIIGTGSISHSNSEYDKYTCSRQKPWTTFTRLRTINRFAFLLFQLFCFVLRL